MRNALTVKILEKPEFSEDQHAATPAARQIHFPIVAPGERSWNPRKFKEGFSPQRITVGKVPGLAPRRRYTVTLLLQWPFHLPRQQARGILSHSSAWKSRILARIGTLPLRPHARYTFRSWPLQSARGIPENLRREFCRDELRWGRRAAPRPTGEIHCDTVTAMDLLLVSIITERGYKHVLSCGVHGCTGRLGTLAGPMHSRPAPNQLPAFVAFPTDNQRTRNTRYSTQAQREPSLGQ
jgi:hypothetical protein